MARFDRKAVERFQELKKEHPKLNNSQIARLMGKDPRQIRRIANDYVKRVGQLYTGTT